MLGNLPLQEIILRLVLAMAIGMIVGGERTRTHRPAGMRTHMLVAIGACVVMMTSEMLFMEYRAYGATPDPARLPAQVINGIGFLGAGTIIKEGFSIKGLTTAASLWTVACLGITCGGGYYEIAIGGAIAVYITLTVVDTLQKHMPSARNTMVALQMVCTDLSSTVLQLDTLSKRYHVNLTNMQFDKEDEESGIYLINVRASFFGGHQSQELSEYLKEIKTLRNVTNVSAKQI